MHLPMSVWAHLYLRMALKAADVGRLGLDEMEISTALSPLVRSRILLVLDYSTTCKPWLAWITLVIDAVPSQLPKTC